MKNLKNKIKGSNYEKKIQASVNSGSFWFSPLDLNTKDYAIECKITDKKGFRITTKLLEKIWGQALSIQKLPLLVIGIRRKDNEVFRLKCFIELERG